jgi:SAM-dependent methyltransferase
MKNQAPLDDKFAGSIPEVYDAYLVPLTFEPYAADLAERLSGRPVRRILELAAGTGVVTRALASAMPASVSIVATDLNQAMIDRAATVGTSRPVTWRQADAAQLPFPDAAFDTVVCQFGVMFFPDKVKAFSEVRRVLARGGVFIFNVWDDLASNEIEDAVTTALESVFPADPPRFLARTPHGYSDTRAIARDLASAGFPAMPEIFTVEARSRAESPRIPALAYCHGTPLRNEIEARDASRLSEATEVVATAMARRFGTGPVDGKMRAHVVVVAA